MFPSRPKARPFAERSFQTLGLAAAAALAVLAGGAWMVAQRPHPSAVPARASAQPAVSTPIPVPPAAASAAIAPALHAPRHGESSGARLAAQSRSGARRTFVDSLYDQPNEGDIPLDPGYIQMVQDKGDTSVRTRW